MTEQYALEGINQPNVEPVSVQTTSAAPISVPLDALTEDGQSLAIQVSGGGSDPADPSTSNYNTLIRTIFTRDGGVVSIGNTATGLSGNGVPVAITPTVDGDTCELTISAGLAGPYNHRLQVQKIRF